MTLEEQLEASRRQLATPLAQVAGIGPQWAELFKRLELFTVRDLLFHFPRDYQDLTRLDAADQLQDKQLRAVAWHRTGSRTPHRQQRPRHAGRAGRLRHRARAGTVVWPALDGRPLQAGP